MGRLTLFFSLFKLVPLLASDIAKATGDKFISLREVVDILKDVAASLMGNVYVKITISGEKKEIPFPELVDIIANFVGEFIDIDRAGIEITKDGLKFIVKPKLSRKAENLDNSYV